MAVRHEKVGVVGVGAVGQACAYSLVLRGSAREVVLVDRTAERAAAVADDIGFGLALTPTTRITSGHWSALRGATVVLICAGINEKSGGATDRDDTAGRLRLLDDNQAVYRDIVPRIVAHAPDAVLLVVTDPPDPLADLTRMLAGHDRVLSTGTIIDTLRFRTHVAASLGVDPSAVEGWVVGEHGTTEVLLWSSVRIGGRPLDRSVDRPRVEHDVRFANIAIIEGNGASQFGIGVAAARIAEAIVRDEHAVLPVAAYRERYGVTVTLPTVVGREGAMGEIEPEMSELERRAFERSVEALRAAGSGLKVNGAA
jgi:L-lactate dehydrogenase